MNKILYITLMGAGNRWLRYRLPSEADVTDELQGEVLFADPDVAAVLAHTLFVRAQVEGTITDDAQGSLVAQGITADVTLAVR